jgi:hypothetical protein
MSTISKAPKREDFKKEFPNIGFERTQHHEALEKWAKEAEEHIAKLEHYRATTEGLWATDKSDKIIDKSLFWHLSF